ncbi:GNAT family N-acetyltransferase [uncultured Sphingomonas sp.]|uniref:GNAT family N-acetyltransferase n=1 Tax=uncultured Sphingomonas sp. TaxID=158754 RepID=UPI0025F19A69|nr:GNAT family N-acetyltransferase [uncultured Sphingomonas sp.]
MTDLTFTDIPRGGYDVMRLQLEVAGLPTDDLDGPDRLFFRLSDGQGPVGYIGLEGNGPDRLLRSLVVMRRHRGHGYGRELVRRLERVCDGAVNRLHLLTIGAAPFFRGLGFVDADRSAAPPAIAATGQFTSICPGSAAYLIKDIA